MNKSNLRETYERVAAIFAGSVISTSCLRVEQQMYTNKSQYEFALKQGNSSSDGPLENLLSDTDAFVMLGLALGLKKQDTTHTPPWYGSYDLFNFPDPQYFVGASGTLPEEWEALLCVYNGKLSFRTGSLERMRATDTSNFKVTPQAQVLKQASPFINDTLAEFGGWDMESRGFVEQQPTMLIDGQQNNTFSLTLGAGDYSTIDGHFTAAGATTPTSRNVLVLRAFGLIIHNGAESAKKFASSWSL